MALSTPGELPSVRAGAAMSRSSDRRTLPSRISSKMAPSTAAPTKAKAIGMQPQQQAQQQQQQQQQHQLNYHAMTTAIFHDNSRNIEELFISAARDGDCERLQNFLAHRDDILLSIDVRDKRSGNTPLIWAAKRGQAKAVTLLLSHGADPTLRNYDGQTALEVASPAIKQALLDSLERDGSAQQRLLQAAWQGNVEVVRALLAGSKAVSIDFRNSDGFTALLLAARDVFLFEKLGPQLVAAYNPRAVVTELLHHRADVNICDFEGKTPLHHIAACKSSLAASLVSCLVSAENLERPDKRCFVPIHCACQSGNADVLGALLAAGSDVNCRGFGGATPLHVSAYNNHDQVAFTLLAHGADASLVDDAGLAPADVARSSRIKKALKEARSAAALRAGLRLAPVKVPGLRGSGNGTPGLANDVDSQILQQPQQQQQQQQQHRWLDGETSQRLNAASAKLEDGHLLAAATASAQDAGNYELGGNDPVRKLGATRGQQQRPLTTRGPSGRDVVTLSGNGRTAGHPVQLAPPSGDPLTARSSIGSGSSSSSSTALSSLPLERRLGSSGGREDSTLSVASDTGSVTAPHVLPRGNHHTILPLQQKLRHPPVTPLYPLASVHDVAAACDTIIVKGRSPAVLSRIPDAAVDEAPNHHKPDRAKSLTPLSSVTDWGKLSALGALPEDDDDASSSPELTSASPCFTRAAAGAIAEGRAGTKLTFYSIGEESDVTPRVSNKSPSGADSRLLLDSTLSSSHFYIERSRTAEHRDSAVAGANTRQASGADVGAQSAPATSDGALGGGSSIHALLGPDGESKFQRTGTAAVSAHDDASAAPKAFARSSTGNSGIPGAASDSLRLPTLLSGSAASSSATSSERPGRALAAVAGKASASSSQTQQPGAVAMDPVSPQKSSADSRVTASAARSVETAHLDESAAHRDAAESPTGRRASTPPSSSAMASGDNEANAAAAESGGASQLGGGGGSSSRPLTHYVSRTEPRDYVVAASKKLYQPMSSLILARLPGGGELPCPDAGDPPVARPSLSAGAPVHASASKAAHEPHASSSTAGEDVHETGRKQWSSKTPRRRSRSRSSGSGCSLSGREGVSKEGLRKDAAVTISFGRHDGPVIEDVFESYPRNAYEAPTSTASTKPNGSSSAEAGGRKKGKAKAAKVGGRKKASSKARGAGGAAEVGSGEQASGPSGKQRSSKQKSTAAVAADAAEATAQGSRRARSGRRRRGQKKAGTRPDGDVRGAGSPVNQARESPSSTALISGVGWQLATKMNIIEVDPEHYQSPAHVTSIPDAVSARAFSFHEMSPLQKREELKRLLLAMRDSTSSVAPGVAVAANASSFIPETMRAIHEFAQTVPDLDEQHEWDALFGLHAKDAMLAVPKLAVVVLEEHRASHCADAAGTLDRRHGGFAALDADVPQPRETRTLAAPAQQPDAASPAAALWVMQEESDLAQAKGTDGSGGAIVELRQPPVPAHQPNALSGGSDGLRRGEDGSLVRDRLHSMIIAGAEPAAATAAALGRLSIDSMAAAIDDILASPPLTPRRRLSKTLLAEIHSSWEEIVGSNSSNSSNSSSSSNASQSNSPSSNGWRAMPEATADDLHQSSGPPMRSGAMDAERGERVANSDMTPDFSYWDDGANAIDLLLKPDDDGSSAAETAGHSRPLLPRCPLEFMPSKSKPPASSGPRTSAHSPKMAAARPTTRVSLRPSRHRPSADPAGVHSEVDPGGQEIDEDLQNREAFLSEANLSTPELSIHTAHESAGVALMHSMAEEILSRPSSRTYTSRLGSRRSARSPRSQVARSQSASTEDSQLKTVTSAAEAGGEILKWKRGNVLGKGAFATVYCGLTSDGQLIAVKQIELNTDDWDKAEREYESVQEEVDLLKALKHRNIVGFLGTSLEDHVVNIFMQFIPGGTLSSLLSRFGAFEEQIFCRYTRQIVDGISYLHSNNVIHRDIKGANIMLMSNGVIKLIDFGCAKRLCVNLSLSASQLQRSMKGTPYWMAPEVVKETGHGKKSDIWSIGCTVFEMATTRPPWAEMQPMAAIFAIGSDRPVPQLPDTFSSLAREFVSACMTRDQSSRLDAAALLAHPFIVTHTSVKK